MFDWISHAIPQQLDLNNIFFEMSAISFDYVRTLTTV